MPRNDSLFIFLFEKLGLVVQSANDFFDHTTGPWSSGDPDTGIVHLQQTHLQHIVSGTCSKRFNDPGALKFLAAVFVRSARFSRWLVNFGPLRLHFKESLDDTN